MTPRRTRLVIFVLLRWGRRQLLRFAWLRCLGGVVVRPSISINVGIEQACLGSCAQCAIAWIRWLVHSQQVQSRQVGRWRWTGGVARRPLAANTMKRVLPRCPCAAIRAAEWCGATRLRFYEWTPASYIYLHISCATTVNRQPSTTNTWVERTPRMSPRLAQR